MLSDFDSNDLPAVVLNLYQDSHYKEPVMQKAFLYFIMTFINSKPYNHRFCLSLIFTPNFHQCYTTCCVCSHHNKHSLEFILITEPIKLWAQVHISFSDCFVARIFHQICFLECFVNILTESRAWIDNHILVFCFRWAIIITHLWLTSIVI